MINSRLALVACPLLAVLTQPCLAQVASVPAPNPDGDFTTALQPGNRGNVSQTRKWLVVDPDPTYLNCRTTPNGEIRSRIAPGAILTAVFSEADSTAGDAIVSQNGTYWLRVTGTDPLTVGTPGICYVRANRRYIAPINEDALQADFFSE
jgi:hypothetical protein